ncbi:TonB-dependent receptor [Hyphomicrobium methylovorum]|uniref:TonB-dependent receptor family protein n=1 Tax=Hyphomicrobium methylovorum TaxID=84 RepID=UPI0015E65048|nr:TonB-dependent receptor [Hyphomicrobium methylovorum]MBA2125039.1 TonB-dependent receptor [Hyphomicrobium methylovorum]
MFPKSSRCPETAREVRRNPTNGHSRRAAVALCALAAFFTGPTALSAQDAEPAQDEISLPDVTVQQTPAQQAAAKPRQGQKSQNKTAAKKPAKPVAQPVQPASLPTSEPNFPLTIDAASLRPAESNPGAPSSGVAGIAGANSAGAQTATSASMKRFENTPVFSVSDILHDVPGVSLKQGNGPRDMGISIRGSNARNGFAIRNIVIFDDGFPVTQPDGLSRSDLIDPRAYSGVDVWRGPSSALFGNYATGGAINFRTRPGGEINGVEYGVDVGSSNYLNNYVIGGTSGDGYEASVFMSDVRGDGNFGYSAFDTQTINALITLMPTSKDRITLKAINNEVDTELPFRMSLNNFKLNPYQKGCEKAATAAPGCVINNFSATGSGTRTPQTAEEAGAGRNDRRSIGGMRWEHDFDAATTGQIQFVIDDRNISQPTGTTSSIGDYLSYNLSTGITNRATFAGLPTLQYLGAFWNYLPVDGLTYNVAPGGNARLGLLQSRTIGSTMNYGARARQEVQLTDAISVVGGATVERTALNGSQRSFRYNPDGSLLSEASVSADREMTNIAPELGVLYRANRQWQLRARVGTGYGTPAFTNLFVTPEGTPGNNTDLKSQKNVGYDLGADWTPVNGVMLSVTGFYEFFNDELVSQAPPTAGLPNFTFNAPGSEHRGIEVAANIDLGGGARLTTAYLFNDQIYTDYAEMLAGAASPVSRNGNKIPGVSPHELTARLSYDVPTGLYKGVGAYVEYQWHDGFYMENANLLTAPGYQLVDVNLHYEKKLDWGPIRSLMAYVEVRNIFDETYIASANNITDAVTSTPVTLANAPGSIYSGAPRTYYGGMKVRF